MEITSYVSPKWVRQMSDSKEIMERVSKLGRKLVLTPNAQGVENALQTGGDSVAVFVGVSDTFNQHTINRSTAESIETLRPTIHQLKNNYHFVRACISTAFHCPYEGFIPLEKTLAHCKKFVDIGVDELSAADTDGMANPLASFTLFHELKKQFPNILITAHFHDTRKLGLATIYASLQACVDRFETSAGGLGGCPFAPGATGNVATEDVLYLLQSVDIATGIDMDKICAAVDVVTPYLSRPIETAMYNLYTRRK
ncbi:hydroxymethylglutaryl-CoA lyase [Sporosarcina sp. P25]|uniref:hydroxymethylglutaryl-CoA lyase n=1 Tax=unclassified Sporosarcina TaxID=2647733 RepID=UPI0026AF42A7